MTAPTQSEKDRVVIFDTTLRDGEQSPGATMTHEEKLEVAELLDDMGVDIIEAGFPIASEGDFLAVNEIAKRTRNAVVCGLSRAGQKDIDRCGEAIRPAQRGRIHTFISTSPVHMKWKLQMERRAGLRDRDRLGDARPQLHRRRRVVEPRTAPAPSPISCAAASRRRSMPARPRSISRIPSATPCRRNTTRCSRWCASACRIPTGRGFPRIATTISAWRWPIRSPAARAGARQIECTINGIGERAGNAALEES